MRLFSSSSRTPTRIRIRSRASRRYARARWSFNQVALSELRPRSVMLLLLLRAESEGPPTVFDALTAHATGGNIVHPSSPREDQRRARSGEGRET